MAFDIEGARRAGYTDDEIADHLGAQRGLDTKAARAAGYTSRELLAELSDAWARRQLPAGVQPSTAGAGRGGIGGPTAEQLATAPPAGLASVTARRGGTRSEAQPYVAPDAPDEVLTQRPAGPMPGQQPLIEQRGAPVADEVMQATVQQLAAMPREQRIAQEQRQDLPGWMRNTVAAANRLLDASDQGARRTGTVGPTLESRTERNMQDGADLPTARAAAIASASAGLQTRGLPQATAGQGLLTADEVNANRAEGARMQRNSLGARGLYAAQEGLVGGTAGVIAAGLRAIGDEETAKLYEKVGQGAAVRAQAVNELQRMQTAAREAGILPSGPLSGVSDYMGEMAVGAANSVGQMIPGLVAGIATGNAAVGMGMMALPVFGQSYVAKRDAGGTPAAAAGYAGAMAALEIIGERYGLMPAALNAFRKEASTKSLEELPGFVERGIAAMERRGMFSKPVGAVLRTQAGEQVGEQITGAGQYLLDGTELGLDQPISVAGFLTNARDTAVQTLLATGAVQAAGAGAKAVIEQAGRGDPGRALGQALGEDVQGTEFQRRAIDGYAARAGDPRFYDPTFIDPRQTTRAAAEATPAAPRPRPAPRPPTMAGTAQAGPLPGGRVEPTMTPAAPMQPEPAGRAPAAQAVDNITGILQQAGALPQDGQDFTGLDETPAAPVIATPLDEAAHAAATSPTNDRPEPTQAQKEAGNYAKGHVRIAGMDFAIENPQGSVRRGVDPDGNAWETPLVAHYGYAKGTRAGDGDHSDVFIKPGTPEDYAGPVFVIDQVDQQGRFDEHKTIIGAATEEEARALYLGNYTPGWTGLGAITQLPIDAYKSWVRDGVKRKPLGNIQGATDGQIADAGRTAQPGPADGAAGTGIAGVVQGEQPSAGTAGPAGAAAGSAVPSDGAARPGSAGGDEALTPAAGRSMMPAGLFVEFGNKRFQVESIADAQAKWEQFRDSADGGNAVGVSQVGNGVRVVDGAGRFVARISYNGRAWDTEDDGKGGGNVIAEAPSSTQPEPATSTYTEGQRVTIAGTPYTVAKAGKASVTLQGQDGKRRVVSVTSDTFKAIKADATVRVTLFRGVPAGQDPRSTANTTGNALFLSPDEKVAKTYAGDGGTVDRREVTFTKLLDVPRWTDAKQALGLQNSDTMQDIIAAARRAGHDGVSFTTTNGKEYIDLGAQPAPSPEAAEASPQAAAPAPAAPAVVPGARTGAVEADGVKPATMRPAGIYEDFAAFEKDAEPFGALASMAGVLAGMKARDWRTHGVTLGQVLDALKPTVSRDWQMQKELNDPAFAFAYRSAYGDAWRVAADIRELAEAEPKLDILNSVRGPWALDLINVVAGGNKNPNLANYVNDSKPYKKVRPVKVAPTPNAAAPVEADSGSAAPAPAAAAPAPRRGPSGKAKHPKTVAGSSLLAMVSQSLGGLDPKWLAEFSSRQEINRIGKDGRRMIQWRNPLIPGVGRLFRAGGTQDLQLLAELLESAGYLEPGSVEADAYEAGQRAKEMVRSALQGDEPLTWEGRIAKAQQEAADEALADPDWLSEFDDQELRAAGYTELAPEVQQATAELLAAAEALGLDTEALAERAAMQTDGQPQDAYHEALQALAREAIAAARQDAAGTDARATGGSREGGGEPAGGQEGGAEALTLQAQTPEDLRAKAEREQAAEDAARRKKAAEQERLRREAEDRDNRARADATRDDFQLGQTAEQQMNGMGDLFADPPAAPAPAPTVARSNPRSTITFAKPITGPSGARLVSYTWQWKPYEYVDARGEERVKRISDWDASEASGDTGRDVVHQFIVEDGGTEKTVSAESALKLLGFAPQSEGRGEFTGVASAAKTLARLRMKQAELEQAKEQFARDSAEVQALALPAMPTERDSKGWFNLGDASVRQIEPGAMTDERRRALIGAWRDNRLAERGWKRGQFIGEDLNRNLADVADRIKRQQAKLDRLVTVAAAVADRDNRNAAIWRGDAPAPAPAADPRALGAQAARDGKPRMPPDEMGNFDRQAWRAGWDQAKKAPGPTPQLPTAQQMASFIGIAADGVDKLRASDVDRVIRETPTIYRVAVAGHIREKRPDLAQEVADSLEDLRAAPAPATVKESLTAAPAEPDALTLTPKQYHDARLRKMADDTGAPLAEVREFYDTEGGRAESNRLWGDAVDKAVKNGVTLSRQTLDKLLELNPTVRLPESAIPEGYQRPEARKVEAEAKDAIRQDRREAKESRAAQAPAEPAAQAAAILDAAAEPPKGKERLDVLKDVKAGAITPDEVAAAYPPADPSAKWAAMSPAERAAMLDAYAGKGMTDMGERYAGRAWESFNVGERATLAAAMGLTPENDRDHFTLLRGTADNTMEKVTFARGEYVTYQVGEGGRWAFGEIDGISHARREFSVDGLWHPFGFAYKAERPAPAPKPDAVPLSSVIDKVNAKYGAGLTDADKVPEKVGFLDAEAALWVRVNAGQATPDEFKAGFESWVSNKAAIVAELSAKTKAELLKMGGPWFANRYKSENKPEVVEALWREGMSAYTLGRGYSYGMGAGSQERAVRALVQGTDANALAQHAAEVKAEQEQAVARAGKMVEAIKDPKTLDDYRQFIRFHQQDGKTFKEARMMLTPEQRAAFDDLTAAESRGKRGTAKEDAQTRVQSAGQTTAGEIIATKHTRDGHDLWVVKLADRVSRDDYMTLLAGAKRLGGNYSSYRGGGAVPGFQFRTPDAAQAFLKLAGGDTAAATEAAKVRRDAFEDDRSQSAVERLNEMADRLDERADESLSRERKANTERRARFAASAEAGARADKAMAQTMRNLAQSIGSGGAKFLDRVRQKVQVELLQRFVASAKYEELRAKFPTYAEQERHRGEPPTMETADYAEFPQYTAYRSDLASLGRQLSDAEGTKAIGQRLLKVADDVSDAFMAFAKEFGNLGKLSTFSVRAGDEVRTAIFPTREGAERAIKRSGITGKAIVFPEKRGINHIIMSPSEAIARGIWKGDADKRITLSDEFGAELVEKIGKAARRGSKVSVPWQFEAVYDRRKTLARMGIETPAEMRAALREFITLRQQPEEASRVKQLERAMVGRRNDGLDFFPTPEAVADEMVEAADIQPGMRVLEPSAGMGHIAERIRASEVEPDVAEFSADRRELLEAKGFNVVAQDFMALEEGGYDRILMNPPFSEGRDIQHVRHAYGLLKPGGRLVAIMGEGAFFRQDKRATEFRDWLESIGATDEKLPEGTFNDPSLPVNTSANARMVVIDKPATGDDGTRFSRDTDTEADFSRRGAKRGVNMRDAEAVVAGVRAAMPTAPQMVLHESVDQAPAELREQIEAAGAANDVEAVYFRGTIHVFPQHFRSLERLEFVVAHHELRHHGLGAILGPRLDQTMMRIYRTNAKVRAAADANIRAGLTDSVVIATEEALADMPVEVLVKLNGWKRIETAIRDWLRAIAQRLQRTMPRLAAALDPKDWTDADIARLVARAEDMSRSGDPQYVRGGAVFGRDQNAGLRGSEAEAIAAGFTLKAYRGISKASPFNDTGTTWLTTSREVAEAYAEEVMGYDDPGVLEVMVRPDGLPRHDASRLTDEQREELQADDFGNPQAVGIYDRSDDHPLGGSRRNVTVIHAPRDAVWVVDDGAKFSRAQPTDPTQTEAFRRWFGNSAVVDSRGRPLVVYHGTGADFNAFAENERGIFFAEDPAEAAPYSRISRDGAPRLMPVYLSIQNPWTLVKYGDDVPYSQMVDQSTQALMAKGYDGIHEPDRGVWIAFRPEQIKSATGNRGTFDPGNPSILEDLSRIGAKVAAQGYMPADTPNIQATRKLASLVKRLEEGKISEAYFTAAVKNLSLQMQDVADTKAANKLFRDRERGPDLVRERLIRARRQGDLEPEAVDFALWALDQNPALADNLGISIRAPKDGRASGDYNPAAEVIRLFKGAGNPDTAVHEILHHAERMMPLEMQDAIRREWAKALAAAMKRATPEQRKALEHIAGALAGDREAYKAFATAIMEGPLNYADHYQLVNPSEFWAVNGARLMGNRFAAEGSVWQRIRNWMREMVQKARGLLGLRSDAQVLAGLDYVTDPDNFGPERGGRFESDVMLSDREAVEASGAVLESVRRPPKHDPDTERALGKAGIRQPLSIREHLGRAAGRAMDLVRDRAELMATVRQGLLDQFSGIQRAVQRDLGGLPLDQDPYIAARLANGGTSSVMRGLLLHGQARWATNGQHLEKIPDTKGLLDILAPLGEDVHDWFGWMIGNRAARLAREGRENNFTDEDIRRLQALATPEKKAAFQKAAMEYAAFKRSVLDVAQAAGLINPETRKTWDYADYIPFYRQIDAGADGVAAPRLGRKGLAGQSSGIRVLRGGDAALNDPIENLLMNFSRLIDASLKNNAIAKTIRLLDEAGSEAVHKVGYDFTSAVVPAEQMRKLLVSAGTPEEVLGAIPPEVFDGMAKLWALQAPTDPEVVRVMVGGRPQFYRVNDPLLLRSLTSFVPFDFPGLGVMRAAKRLLTSMVTATPEFLVRNFIRDSVAAQAITRAGFSPTKSFAGIVKSWRETGGAEAMLFAGASFGSGQVNAADPSGTAAELRRALRARGMSAAGIDGYMASLLDTPAKLWEKWRNVTDAVENANREAVYEAATRAGGGATAAAYEAKDLMDFSLRGSWPAYQLLADVVPFLNARVQGLYRLGRADPKRMAAVGGLLLVATLLLALQNDGEDWYEELPDWDKDTNWHFRIGGQHFRIPKPFELGVIFATIPERIGRSIKGLDDADKTAARLWANVRDQLAFDPVPQLIRPILNVWGNWDTFRQAPIETERDEGKLPAQRYDARTSDTARVVVGAAAPVTNELGLSPKRLEYLVTGYFGTVGAYALGLSDMAVRKIEGKPQGPSLRPDDVPLVRAFYRVDPARATVYESDLYLMRQEVEQIYRSVTALQKDDQAAAAELATQEQDKLALRSVIVTATKRLAALRRQADAIYADRGMSPEEKRAQLDALQVQRNAIAKQVATMPEARAAF